MALLPALPPVHFDFGAIGVLADELKTRGIERPLIITDAGLTEHGVVDQVRAALPGNPDIAVYDGIPPNPTVAGIEGALAVYREQDCDGVIALGGGSVLDSGKALRAAATHPEPIIEYLKDPSRITANVAPYITIPTTAGTGAEITFGGGIQWRETFDGFGTGPNTRALERAVGRVLAKEDNLEGLAGPDSPAMRTRARSLSIGRSIGGRPRNPAWRSGATTNPTAMQHPAPDRDAR